MRLVPVLISKANFDANPPPCRWHALDIADSNPAALLVIAHFHDPAEGIKWCAQPQCKPMARRHALVPPIAVTLLGPPYGVVATDTVADALEKIAAVSGDAAIWEAAG